MQFNEGSAFNLMHQKTSKGERSSNQDLLGYDIGKNPLPGVSVCELCHHIIISRAVLRALNGTWKRQKTSNKDRSSN